jgi:hypothetical protein
MICPVMSYRYHNCEIMCTENCAWFNTSLKGCHFASFVINFNRIARGLNEKPAEYVKTMAEFKDKYKGMSQEEIKEQVFK